MVNLRKIASKYLPEFETWQPFCFKLSGFEDYILLPADGGPPHYEPL